VAEFLRNDDSGAYSGLAANDCLYGGAVIIPHLNVEYLGHLRGNFTMINREDNPVESALDVLSEFQQCLVTTTRPSRTRRPTERGNSYGVWLEFSPRDNGNTVPGIPTLPWRHFGLDDLHTCFAQPLQETEQEQLRASISRLRESPVSDSRTLNILMVGFHPCDPADLQDLTPAKLDKADIKDQLHNLALDLLRNGGRTWTWKPDSKGPHHIDADYSATGAAAVARAIGADKIDLILLHYDLLRANFVSEFTGTGAQAGYPALLRPQNSCLSTGEILIPHYGRSHLANLRGVFEEIPLEGHPLELAQAFTLDLQRIFSPGARRQRRHTTPWLRYIPSPSGEGPPPVKPKQSGKIANPGSPSGQVAAGAIVTVPSEAAGDAATSSTTLVDG